MVIINFINVSNKTENEKSYQNSMACCLELDIVSPKMSFEILLSTRGTVNKYGLLLSAETGRLVLYEIFLLEKQILRTPFYGKLGDSFLKLFTEERCSIQYFVTESTSLDSNFLKCHTL